jgi:hypothetical protein
VTAVGFLGGGGRDLGEYIPGKNKTVRFDANPLAEALSFLLVVSPVGIAFMLFGLYGVVVNMATHGLVGLAAMVAVFLFGCLLNCPGVLMLYVAIDSSRCLTMEALSAQLNLPEEALHQAALEKGIVARYDVVGRSVYRAADFDSLTLLRASTPPGKPGELLRASSNRPTNSDLLLRKSSSPGTQTKSDDTESDIPSDGRNC